MDGDTSTLNFECTCEWCKKPFEDDHRAAKYCSFLCRDYARGKEIAERWANGQRDEDHQAMMRRVRARALCKLNNVVRFLPPSRVRPYKKKKGQPDL